MMFLRPVGGLCNRLRTIDSILSICTQKNYDLTILWVKNNSLNIDFQAIFEDISVENIRVTVLNCPAGYPDNFIENGNLFFDKSSPSSVGHSFAIRRLKNLAKGRFLNVSLKEVNKVLKNFESDNILTDSQLSKLYDSEKGLEDKTSRQMDKDFIPKVAPILNTLLSQEKCYISSCYRMFPLQSAYSYFKPTKEVNRKIAVVSKKFKNTIGLHIRRSDHVASKTYSTTEKFISVIESELLKSPNTTFFLSTDDALTKENLIASYGGRIIYNEVESYSRNNPEAVKDAVVDLYCLSKTSKIYGSHHSSFSQTASDIGEIEEITAK